MNAAHGSAGRTLSGLAMGVGAVACFAALDTATKYTTAAVPLFMALWFRYAFQAVATTAVVLPLRGPGALRTQQPGFQVLRGALLLASSLFAFASLRYLPVGEFTAMVMLAPLAVTLLAATVLKEHVSGLRWALVAGGFAGAIVIIRPGGAAFTWASLLPLCLVGTNAWFQVLTSKLARTEDPVTMQLWTGWVGTLLATLPLPWVWVRLDDLWLWACLAFMGLSATVGHFMLILAYQRAPASTLTPFMYTQIAFATLGGWWVFSHVPDGTAVTGMGMIAVCGAAGAWLTVKERLAALRASKA